MTQIGKDWSKLPEANKNCFRDLSMYLIEKYCTGALDDEETILAKKAE
jgi:hypothetical protein